ncbi:MAG TPA: hypothetical protein VK335_15460 [Bryobacteraceae bacterium]|nr:hypothetical protein [Bryobacteraceae bacterium]
MKRLAALLPILASSACAQCVMCFRTAAAQNSARARVMNMGIIIMVIPPVLILAGFMVLAYKRRKTYADAEPVAEGEACLAPTVSSL